MDLNCLSQTNQKMTEQERRLRLNELGKEIATMYPKSNGSVTFDYSQGQLKGVRTDDKWRPEK